MCEHANVLSKWGRGNLEYKMLKKNNKKMLYNTCNIFRFEGLKILYGKYELEGCESTLSFPQEPFTPATWPVIKQCMKLDS